MIGPTLSTSASLAVALWAIVMLGALSPSSVPREGPLVPSFSTTKKSDYDPPRAVATEVKARLARGEVILVVDVRAPESYAHEHIGGAVSSPWRDMAKGFAMLPKDKLLLLYCT